MSNNIISTIGQHVFKYDSPEYTEAGAPVYARNPTPKEKAEAKKKGIEPKSQFLGEGYYFWDNNIRRAHKWGKDHYKGKYRILEIPLVLMGEKFLDLVGSREDLRIFLDAYYDMKKKYSNLKIGAFLHGMQTMAKHRPEVWPFTIIRALNIKSNDKKKEAYNHLPNANMLLDPEIIICFYDKNELDLQKIRFLDKNDQIWTPEIS